MVRRCAVANCESNDKIILSHRFPTKVDISIKWAKELNLEHMDLTTLMYNYTVCSMHFEASAYRNPKSNNLNITAIPTLHPHNPRHYKLDSEQDEQDKNTSSYVSILGNEYSSDTDDVDPLDLISYTSFSSPGRSCDAISVEQFEENDISDLDMDKDSNCEVNLDLADIVASNEDDQFAENNFKPSVEDYDEGDYLIVVDDNAINSDAIEGCTECNEDLNDNESNEDYAAKTCEVAVQVDTDELEKFYDTNDDYNKLSRSELIQRLQEYEKLIKEQQEKLASFQHAHAILLQSMDTFKQLMSNKQ